MHIYGIDVNPTKTSEFIVNGNDEYVRMFDFRRLPNLVKQFRRQPPNFRVIKYFINLNYSLVSNILGGKW